MVSLTITPQAPARSSAPERSPQAQPQQAQPQQTPPGRFICPICKRSYGDPLYHGPAGHAPMQMCFDCWAGEWACMVQMVSRGGDWRKIDSALFLMCQGFSCTEAANLAGICRKTLHNWIRRARQHPEMAPDWLIERARQRELSRR